MSELREKLVHALETVIKDGVADFDGTHHISAELVLELINGTPSDDIIFCKDCAKHNVTISKAPYPFKEYVCPLVVFRGGSQGHEHDYQFCCYGKRRTDVSD